MSGSTPCQPDRERQAETADASGQQIGPVSARNEELLDPHLRLGLGAWILLHITPALLGPILQAGMRGLITSSQEPMQDTQVLGISWCLLAAAAHRCCSGSSIAHLFTVCIALGLCGCADCRIELLFRACTAFARRRCLLFGGQHLCILRDDCMSHQSSAPLGRRDSRRLFEASFLPQGILVKAGHGFAHKCSFKVDPWVAWWKGANCKALAHPTPMLGLVLSPLSKSCKSLCSDQLT